MLKSKASIRGSSILMSAVGEWLQERPSLYRTRGNLNEVPIAKSFDRL